MINEVGSSMSGFASKVTWCTHIQINNVGQILLITAHIMQEKIFNPQVLFSSVTCDCHIASVNQLLLTPLIDKYRNYYI